MAPVPDAAHVTRHPIRGALAGFVGGFGVSLLLVSFSVIALGTIPPLLIPFVGAAIGILVGSLAPAREKAAPGPPSV